MKPLKKLLSILMISAILIPTVGVSTTKAEEYTALTKFADCLTTCENTTSAWTFQRIGCKIDCHFNLLWDVATSEPQEAA